VDEYRCLFQVAAQANIENDQRSGQGGGSIDGIVMAADPESLLPDVQGIEQASHVSGM
jgi:hypothetical protein